MLTRGFRRHASPEIVLKSIPPKRLKTSQIKIMSTSRNITRNTKVLPVIAIQQSVNISKLGYLRSTNSFATSIRFSLDIFACVWTMEYYQMVEPFLRHVSLKQCFKAPFTRKRFPAFLYCFK